MLDIKFIRENLELVKEGARKKHVDVDLNKLISLDDERKTLLKTIEEKRAAQNDASDIIAKGATDKERYKLIEKMKVLKEDLQKEEEKLRSLMTEWQTLMLQVPNIPDVSVPEGEDDTSNKELKTWGDKPTFSFTPKSHIELMTALDMVDFERGVKVSGFRGYFLKKDGALLSHAIWNYAQDFFLKKGFEPMIVPSLVRKTNLYGTGHLPNDVEDLYVTQDDDFLSGTAEVATMGYYSDEVVEQERLPIKLLSFSPCFRREAGSHGKDTKGLIRVHEFYKLEQVVLCEANHEESVKWHEWIQKNTEEFIESLKIPYRTVINCGGDLGQGQVKKYDIELWVPLEETYREISSASYFHDFQTRRFNIRYRDKNGKLQYAHSLNCTAIPTPRILVSLAENYQQENGSVLVPDVLQKYLGKKVIEP